VAFAAVTIGIVGMVAHFWIEELNGMACRLPPPLQESLCRRALCRGLRAAPIPAVCYLGLAAETLSWRQPRASSWPRQGPSLPASTCCRTCSHMRTSPPWAGR
jgi:hypothetical protein